MKIRRPDAHKALRQLERQHMAAAEREARTLRPRTSAPSGFHTRADRGQAAADVVPLAEAMEQLNERVAPVVERMFRAAVGGPVPGTFRREAAS